MRWPECKFSLHDERALHPRAENPELHNSNDDVGDDEQGEQRRKMRKPKTDVS